MEYLVTGGAGFIGSHVVRALLAREGTRLVRVWDNLSSGSDARVPVDERVIFRSVDVGKDADLDLVRHGPDPAVVVHCVGPASTALCEQDPYAAVWANVMSIVLVRRMFPKAKVVYLSRLRPPDTVYDKTKVMGAEFLATYDAPFQVVRISTVYGPGQTKGVVGDFVRDTKKHKAVDIYGDGDQWLDFVHIDAVVDAVVACAVDLAGAEPVDVFSGERYQVVEVARMFRHHYNGLDFRFLSARPWDKSYPLPSDPRPVRAFSQLEDFIRRSKGREGF